MFTKYLAIVHARFARVLLCVATWRDLGRQAAEGHRFSALRSGNYTRLSDQQSKQCITQVLITFICLHFALGGVGEWGNVYCELG